MPGIYCKLKALSPDAVLVNGWGVKTCIQALIACRRLGIPCIVRGEANLLRLRAWWKHKIHDFLLPWYSAFLAIGSANRDFYRLHRIPARKIFCAPYAVDNRFFLEQAGLRRPQRESLRAEFGIPPGATTFLFVGKLEGKKHPLDLLRALNQQTSAERSRAHVLIAGDGDLMSGCKEFASANSLPVMFAGFVNQTRLPDLYAAADVLVLPSDAGETWGLVVNEAMASGLPAIVSRAAGCSRDLILEGETGFTFDVGDIQTLTSLLRRYLAVPDLAMVQGRRAAQHIQNFGLSQIAEGLAAAVGFCMQRRR
jgi:glycosyltransferase involved in cell wall biosynthesis